MTTETGEVFRLASDYVDEVAALDPTEATYMGVPGYDDKWPDLSPDGLAARAALIRRTLDDLRRARPAGEDEALAAAVMGDALAGDLGTIEAGDPYYDLRNIAGPIQTLVEIFDLMEKGSEAGWRAIVGRLEGLPAAAAGLQRLYGEGIRTRRLSARRQVDEVLRQLDNFAGRDAAVPPAFGELGAALAASGVATPGLTADLERAVGGARAAFTDLHGFLAERYLDAAPVAEAAGEERYARAARRFLGVELDLAETYAWGWGEVRRLHGEMGATAERIKPGASIPEAVAILDADPERAVHGEAALLAWLQEFQDTAIRELDGAHFDIPAPVRRIEAMIAPPGGALAQYYTPPSDDFSRPGRTWYPTGGKERFHRWRDVTVAYHEGTPGHHLQNAIAVYQREHLSRFQRLALWYPGHGEGWALYAERLMAELGYLDDPGDYMGMLIGQMHRAVRVVVDLGMHLQLPIPDDSDFAPGQPWTYERMLAFLMEKAQLPYDEAQSEVVRYLGWPAQAISYKVGERAWLQIREESRARHGDAFSLKTFHTVALNLGSMGLDLLREQMRAAY